MPERGFLVTVNQTKRMKGGKEMYYNETPETALQRKIDEYRDAAAIFPAIRKVTTEYNGKVLNCRFEKALRAETGKSISVKKNWKWLQITIYFGGYEHTLASVELDSLPDGKRIPAEMIIESAREKRESNLKHAAALEESAGKVHEWKQQLAHLEKVLSALVDSIPYETRDIYRINYHMRNY